MTRGAGPAGPARGSRWPSCTFELSARVAVPGDGVEQSADPAGQRRLGWRHDVVQAARAPLAVLRRGHHDPLGLRGCGAAGSKVYSSAEDAARYARAGPQGQRLAGAPPAALAAAGRAGAPRFQASVARTRRVPRGATGGWPHTREVGNRRDAGAGVTSSVRPETALRAFGASRPGGPRGRSSAAR